MSINAKTGLNALGDRELGALIRASPLYPILIEFEKENAAPIAKPDATGHITHDIIHTKTI